MSEHGLPTCGAVGKDGSVEAVNNARNEELTSLLIDIMLYTFNNIIKPT